MDCSWPRTPLPPIAQATLTPLPWNYLLAPGWNLVGIPYADAIESVSYTEAKLFDEALVEMNDANKLQLIDSQACCPVIVINWSMIYYTGPSILDL